MLNEYAKFVEKRAPTQQVTIAPEFLNEDSDGKTPEYVKKKMLQGWNLKSNPSSASSSGNKEDSDNSSFV